MFKKIENTTLFLLIIFSVYCALINGMSLDIPFDLRMGKERLKYLFSLGSYEDYDFRDARFYPGFYNTLSAFITKMFPSKYELDIWYLNNLFLSFLTNIGISRIAAKLFNKKVGKIVFLISFFNPIFFGHMAMNSKDTIIAFANIWTVYLILRYCETQQINNKRNYYSALIGLTVGLGSGVRFAFIATLLPMLILLIVEIFYFKKFISSKFSIKFFFIDLTKVLLIAYSLMVVFWPDTHGNIFISPFKLFFESSQSFFGTGWILFNGNYHSTIEVPKSYIIINLLYKTPEFVLICYGILIYLFFNKKFTFSADFNFLRIKIFSILFIIFFTNIYLFVIPYRIYDGLRLFLYIVPYLSIIPGLIIYFLIYDFKSVISKFFITIIFSSFLYYLFIFISLTPYQYTYINSLNGNFSNSSKKFENDYWAVSIEELIMKISQNKIFDKESEDKIKIAFCGLEHKRTIAMLNNLGDFKFKFINYHHSDDFNYVMMTNRSQTSFTNDTLENVKSCFKKFRGKNLVSVKRNGLILSTLRKINN